jgi:hypothetical protein
MKKEGGIKMEKKLVVFKQDIRKNGDVFSDIFKDNGWKLEIVDLSAPELMPKGL